MDRNADKLDKDTITCVLSHLNTPKDLANAACVCHAWHKCVIEGKLWRKLCIKFFPEIDRICRSLEGGGYLENPHQTREISYVQAKSGPYRILLKKRICRSLEGGGYLENPHQTREISYVQAKSCPYGILLKKLLSPPLQRTCISEPLHASSTDNLPDESIAQTLYPGPSYHDHMMPSCWSSRGELSKDVPETLTYRLVSDLCVVQSVKVQPYLVYYQSEDPIYSSEMIRFRFGYSRSPRPHWSGLMDCFSQRAAMDDYVWTYVSPTFPMRQENVLQTFELPKPTLCIGGILQIELIGRVQTQRSDGLYYIGVNYVHVTGRPISYLKLDHVDDEGQYYFRQLSLEEASSSFLRALKSHQLVGTRHNSIARLLRYLKHSGLPNDSWMLDD